MRILIIANPKSGKGAARRIMPPVKGFFEKEGAEVEIYTTKIQNDAINRAKKAADSRKYDVIIASGGDGTINEVINGLARAKNKRVKFGIIPLGTENVLAQEMGIPFDAMKAAHVIIDGRTRRIDIGKANKRYFVLMAGIGFDAHVASVIKPLLKKLMGSAIYPLTAWNELFRYKHADIRITIDGKKRAEGGFVVVGNTKLYGAKIAITPQADMTDGLLDVCIFKGRDILSFLKYAAGMIAGQHTNFSDIEYYKAKDIVISSKPKVLCHVDCEIIGKTPVRIKVLPKAVEMIVP